jgi:hypothetical protein
MLGTITATYTDLAARLGMDLAAALICFYAIYYRRHARRDLVMAYVCFNVGLFVVLEVISTQSVSAGLGLGLFGILSIVRLRSEPFSNGEMGYFFVALVMGLLNGIGMDNMAMAALLNVVVIATVYVADHPQILAAVHRQRLVLDTVHRSEAALRADLEDRLGVEIDGLTVIETDYVREVTIVDVRHSGRPVANARLDRTAQGPELRIMRSETGA